MGRAHPVGVVQEQDEAAEEVEEREQEAVAWAEWEAPVPGPARAATAYAPNAAKRFPIRQESPAMMSVAPVAGQPL